MIDWKPIAEKFREADAILIGASNGLFITEGLHLFADNLFLTKRPEDIVFSTTLENAWFGVTVTSSKEKNRIQTLREHIHGGHYHVTFEPMFDEVGMVDLTGIEWIVIGTETGHRKGKAVSKPEWVWNLTHQAHALGIPVFMKEDLLPIMGEAQMVQEFPPAFYRVLEEQKTWRK